MPSSRAWSFVAVAAAMALPATARAQQTPEGFGVERLYTSAPGAGWIVMDALDMRGGLGGAMALTTSYAHDPMQVRSSDGSQHLAVVSDQAFADFGFAATYDRFRLYLDVDVPVVGEGQSGTVGQYSFTAPNVDPATHPDVLSDARVGFDARVVGDARSAFRLGLGAQLYVPNGSRSDYVSDGTYRAMGRVLFAGDVGSFTYAGQLGVHVRPLDDSPAPVSPHGSELLFGVAGGARVAVLGGSRAVVVGPEIFGASAFSSLFNESTTALEGLLSGRIEGTADDGERMRIKLGAGVGLDPRFGAPEWRLVFSIEAFNHHSDRDHDNVSDSKDACPDTPGVKTEDRATTGCPQAAPPSSPPSPPVEPAPAPAGPQAPPPPASPSPPPAPTSPPPATSAPAQPPP